MPVIFHGTLLALLPKDVTGLGNFPTPGLDEEHPRVQSLVDGRELGLFTTSMSANAQKVSLCLWEEGN